jgi:hypothetical protein
MSVKTKVKRCNKEIKRLESRVKDLEIQNDNLRKNILKNDDNSEKTKLYANIIKFAITNHIGGLNAGMKIERRGIDKMQDLSLNVEYEPMFNSYIMRVHY